jgi:hypothetical protein
MASNPAGAVSPPDEVVVVVDRYKLRKSTAVAGKRNIIASIEGYYANERSTNGTLVKSKEQRAVKGAEFYLTWNANMISVTIHLYSITDRLTYHIGSSVVPNVEFQYNQKNVGLYVHNCGEVVGKIYVTLFARQLFHDEVYQRPSVKRNDELRIQRDAKREEKDQKCQLIPPEGFKFNRLSRPINWERLRCLNLRRYFLISQIISFSSLTVCISIVPHLRIAEHNEVEPLMSILNDVLTGDVGNEGVCF